MPGVIIGVSGPRKAVIRHFVPFFARDLARFATNAYGRIGEEADFDVFLHVIVPALIRALYPFADHLVKTRRRAPATAGKLWSRPTICSRPIIPFFPPCHDYAKIFPRSAHQGAAVPDANSVADRLAARFAPANQEKPGHAASVPG